MTLSSSLSSLGRVEEKKQRGIMRDKVVGVESGEEKKIIYIFLGGMKGQQIQIKYLFSFV